MLSEFLQDTFQRFHGSFGAWGSDTAYSPTCLNNMDQAVELVTDEISTRLRSVPGYTRRLREPIIAAFNHIDTLVEQVPGVLPCRGETFSADPHVNAFFVSRAHLQEVFSESKEVRDIFQSHPSVDECFGLLCMQREERTRFGIDINGNEIRRDVMQTEVSFTDHQIVSPGIDEAQARCALKCCVFKSFIQHIRNEASANRAKSMELESLRATYSNRLARLGAEAATEDRLELERKLAAIDEDLTKLEPRITSPESQLSFVVSMLSDPQKYLNGIQNEILVDRMGIKRDNDSTGAVNRLLLSEITVANHQPRVAVLVRFPRHELLPERDFLREASLFLSL